MDGPRAMVAGRWRTRRDGMVVLFAVALACALALAIGPSRARSASSPFTEYPISESGSHPFLIGSGPDGRLWYTVDDQAVEAMTTAGKATAYPSSSTGGLSTGIAQAPNGTLAFLQGQSANYAFGSLSEVGVDGALAHGPLDNQTALATPNQITTGPDGKLWWTTNSSVCTATAALTSNPTCQPLAASSVGGDGITTGPDGNVWLTERTNNEIYRISPNFDHQDFPLPHSGSNPYGITAGPDGALWFTEIGGERIGRITTSGQITEFDLPNAVSDPMGITAGPDGALWFTESAGNRIGRITTSGKITEFPIPTPDAGARGIVTGPDGALWFTEERAGQIGRYLPEAAPPPPGGSPTAAVTASTTTPLAGRLFTLDPSASTGGAGSLTRFAYDFDGSGKFLAICPPTEPIAYKIFDTPGSHVISMQVTNSSGSIATTHITVDVVGPRSQARAAGITATSALSHFWCGDAASLFKGSTAYLPIGFTSDVHAVGIDVTQGVVPDPPRPTALSKISAASAVKLRHSTVIRNNAPTVFPLNNDKQDPRTNRITWLQRFGTTVVRVYASALIAPNDKDVPNVQMKLYGFRDGHELAGSPLLSQTGPLDVPLGPPFTTHAMRVGYSPVDGALPAFTFTLPEEWVNADGNVAMLAVPQLVGPRLDRQCSTLTCKLAQQAGSGDFQFSNTGLFIIRTVAMTASGDPALPDPFKVFDAAANLSPVAVLPSPYQGTIDITPITKKCTILDKSQPCKNPNGWVTTQIGNWLTNNPPLISATFKVATIGVHKNHGNAQGYSNWPGTCPDNPTWGGAICESSTASPVSQVEANRPLTSVAHEMFHDLGRPHADDSSSGCGGNGEGKPDSKGDTLSIGLDRHPGSGGSVTNPYQIISPGLPGQKVSIYDPMSYCADNNPEDNTWLSAHNWDELAGEWIFFLKRAAASSFRAVQAAAGGSSLEVTGVTEGSQTMITQVEPAAATAASAAAATANSPVHAVVRNAAGAVVGDAPLQVMSTGHLDSGTTGKPSIPVMYFHGTVPAAGADRVQIVQSGAVTATETRSPHAPTVRLIAPRGGTIGKGRSVTVRWSAGDRDHDALSASVDYSSDGGRDWHTVFTGAGSGRSIKLPSRYFTGSRNARLRVRVNDGFNETRAVSNRLRAIGSPPAVTITAPRNREVFPSDAAIALSGAAFDDGFKLLTGNRLRWFAGRRSLGTGQSVTARDLPPGRVRIRLLARESGGRSATASITIRVTPAAPFFTTLIAPTKISPAARRIMIRVATNLTSTLTVSRRHFALSRRARTVTIAIKPGNGALTVELHLAAHGKRATQTLRITRR